MELEVTLKIQLSDEDIDDIMSTALEGGINYWCDEVEVAGDYLGKYASDQISRGGMLKIHDVNEDKVYILTKEKFLEGFKKYVKQGNVSIDRELNNGIYTGNLICDTCNIDANDADSIIQLSLFGEEVFG